MKENNFTEQENNYINEQNGYTDKSTNVFYETVASTRFVVAKPVSADAKLVITSNDLGLAIELVRGLRTQEIKNVYATKNRAKRVPTRKESLVERNVGKMKRFFADVAKESEGIYPNFSGFVGEDRREDLANAAESYNQPEGNTVDL